MLITLPQLWRNAFVGWNEQREFHQNIPNNPQRPEITFSEQPRLLSATQGCPYIIVSLL